MPRVSRKSVNTPMPRCSAPGDALSRRAAMSRTQNTVNAAAITSSVAIRTALGDIYLLGDVGDGLRALREHAQRGRGARALERRPHGVGHIVDRGEVRGP